MDSKDVERIIDANQELELGGKVAADAGNNTNNDSAPVAVSTQIVTGEGCQREESLPGGHETSSRRDTDKTGDGTGAEANGAPLLLQAVVEQDPGQTGHGSGEVRHVARVDGLEVHGEGRAAVEAEPADPQEDGPEDDVGDVVWAVGQAVVLVIAGALAEHQAVGQGAGSGGDVDGTATGEIVAGEVREPAVAVPGPVGNGIVDNSSLE